MTLQATKQVIKEDEKVFCVAARVARHPGEATYYETTREGQIQLSVITLSSHTPINALLGGGDDARRGFWFIPAEGTEVLIHFSDGEFEGDAYVVGFIGRGPTSMSDAKILILHDNVEIRSVDGTAKQLAYKSDVEAVDAKYADHVHQTQGGDNVPTLGPVTTVPLNPSPPPFYIPGTGVPLAGADIVGTQVLKGE